MGKRKKPTDDASQAGPSKRKKGNAALSKQIKSSIPAKTTFTETSKTESAHKRPRLPGKVKRLSTSHPKTTLSRQHGSHEAGVTLSGAKVNSALGTGGFLSGTHGERGEEEIWVTRKTDFAYSLKRSLAAFVKRGRKHLIVHAMGAAIPLAMTLALAVKSNLPGEAVALDVRTDSVECQDEVIPQDEDAEDVDIQFQTRTKSVVRIRVSLPANPKR